MDDTATTLDEWLSVITGTDSIPSGYIAHQFPTQRHFDEYMVRILSRPESEILALLRMFLLQSATLGIDDVRYESLALIRDKEPELYANMMGHSYYQRLKAFYERRSSAPPWEGITWILDLLPHWPGEALRALDAYFLAHALVLPDGRLHGLCDAMSIIRAWYIGVPGNYSERLEALTSLSSRDFEHVIHTLYVHMKYDTTLTPPRKDGGRDILANRADPGHTESLRIECKRWSQPVGVEYARALLGVVSSEKVNKGVLVTCGRFTRGTHAFAASNPRIELIPGQTLVPLMNEHLGTNWPIKLDRIILESKTTAKTGAT